MSLLKTGPTLDSDGDIEIALTQYEGEEGYCYMDTGDVREAAKLLGYDLIATEGTKMYPQVKSRINTLIHKGFKRQTIEALSRFMIVHVADAYADCGEQASKAFSKQYQAVKGSTGHVYADVTAVTKANDAYALRIYDFLEDGFRTDVLITALSQVD